MGLFSSSPIGYFGKLPSHPDFVRRNAGNPLARALDNWMHEGLATLNMQGGDTWKADFDAATLRCFIYRADDPGKALAGMYMPSQDQSGRRYPFSIFATASPGRNGHLVHLLPEAYAVFFKASARLLNDQAGLAAEVRTGKPTGLATVLPQGLHECERRFERYIELKKAGDFWEATLGADQERGRFRLMRNLLSTVAPLRGKDVRKFELCLAFPLSPNTSERGFEAGIWLALCSTLVPQAAGSLVAFWDAAETENARLYVFFRSPAPKYVGYLINPAAADDAIWDLAVIGKDKDEDPKAGLPPEVALLIEDSDGTIKEFLEKLTV